ncbi:MAG: prolyl oligopeptidase family serine peptidase [Ornithinimicrobium sp.]|uniref:prolyl oligopeptidase family serine peptidase n=1 Tax=Ornithinimicrobium sp. TaxID=1977084 RepID=UPI0026DFCFB9|nr:prolyl oligopeptidase family serine peptidase [Ornithinimicrobium sp.]MDO5739332.1 prolyl oligopeptidase family serine peptidase [Ornithinimicrobium sp.]
MDTPDPHLWLEVVESSVALEWVSARSRAAERQLQALPLYPDLHTGIRDALEASDRIPLVSQVGDLLYGFWTDADHPRGVWRRTTWESYRTVEPEWEVLLDVDALGATEGIPWVWQGASILRPSFDRALVHLSRGGSDAGTTRELDLATLEWVPEPAGFAKAEAKGRLAWRDRDHVWLTTAADPTGATRSGYPRTLRLWERGTPIETAAVVHTVDESDLGLFVEHDQRSGRTLLRRAITFYTEQVMVLGEDGQLDQLPVPDSADVSVHQDWVALRLRHAWTPWAQTVIDPTPETPAAPLPAGSLLVSSLTDALAGRSTWTPLFVPDDRSALVDLTWTEHHLVTTVLVDVRHTVQLQRHCPTTAGAWSSQDITADLDLGLQTVSVSAVDDDTCDDLWLVTTGFLEPMSLAVARVDGPGVALEQLKTAPARFDAAGLEVTQHFATSSDGTRVPYWQVGPSDLPADGSTPTVLHGYGGFEQALTPAYDPIVGRSWLAHGFVHVVAGIRGGGEYGPRWHQAALQAQRPRAYEDFVAVARDLVARRVTRVERLGCTGRSNGGLLVGNMLTQYPEDFGAIVCQVPLLDMQRYHRLLAGSSWMAEYGDPDDAEQWEWLQTFSPYQLLDPQRPTPPVYLSTSTRDDRVHPAHARKMTAALEDLGRDVTYWENTEGGHGGASTADQWATWHALSWAFLHARLAAS